MLPAEVDILLVTERSLEEDSETNDQSYFPPRSMLKLGRVMLLISCVWCLGLLCHLISLDMLCVNATCLVSNYHICELCIAILLKDIIYVNYTMLSLCKGIIYVNYAMPCWLANHHVCELYHAIIFCITCSICRQRLYIQLLFLCISHLKQRWKYLE